MTDTTALILIAAFTIILLTAITLVNTTATINNHKKNIMKAKLQHTIITMHNNGYTNQEIAEITKLPLPEINATITYQNQQNQHTQKMV